MNLPAIVRGMSDTEYHAHPALGSTDLKNALRSPAHFQANRRAPTEEETAAKRDGKILHTCILEPHTFDAKYAVTPPDAPSDLRRFRNAKTPAADTLASIAWWDAWDATNPGKAIIKADLYESCRRIAEAVRTHPALRGYFDGPDGEAELSMFATDPETGLPVKCRNDWRKIITSYRVVLDMKSCEDARPDPFSRNAFSYGYFLSDAYYTDVNEWAGEPIDLFLLVAFEKENATLYDPGHFPIKVYEASPRGMELGRAQYRKALSLVKHCADMREYPAYDTEVEVLEPPTWAKA